MHLALEGAVTLFRECTVVMAIAVVAEVVVAVETVRRVVRTGCVTSTCLVVCL